MSDSTLYTIGTALNRARDNGLDVEIMVEGSWVRGQVAAVDGHGVVVACEDRDHTIIRIEAVSAVRVMSPAPQRVAIPAGASDCYGAGGYGASIHEQRDGWNH